MIENTENIGTMQEKIDGALPSADPVIPETETEVIPAGLLTATEIWRRWVKHKGDTTPLAVWIQKEKDEHSRRDVRDTFIVWLNKRYTKGGENFWIRNKDKILGKTRELLESVSTNPDYQVPPVIKRRPLGMHPLLTAGLIIGAATALIWTIGVIINNKKQE